MGRDLLTKGDAPLYNVFTPFLNYLSVDIKYVTGYIYLNKMSMGDRVHIRVKINDKVHLYLEYKDQQIMTVVYVDPLPIMVGDRLIIEARNLSTNLQIASVSYIFYLEY